MIINISIFFLCAFVLTVIVLFFFDQTFEKKLKPKNLSLYYSRWRALLLGECALFVIFLLIHFIIQLIQFLTK